MLCLTSGGTQEKIGKKIYWLSWEKLCLAKKHEGLGFKDIELFNQSLLGKQACRILHLPNSLLARVIISRYFIHCNFLSASEGTSIWQDS